MQNMNSYGAFVRVCKTKLKLEQRCFLNISRTQVAEIDLDLKLVRARTKHVFPVNLAQIRSAVPDIFHTQTKKSHTAPKTEP